MGLFTKYKENQEKFVSGSVVSQLPPNRKNTLFNGATIDGSLLKEEQITQTTSTQDVTLGRVESSLFKKRQELDEQRIENFLKTPGGQTHKTKEIRLARTNPVFSPELGSIGQNPTKNIIPNKVAINAGLSGGGVFEDKFGLISNITNDGYVKYRNNPDKSKLAYLAKKYGYDKGIKTNDSGFLSGFSGRLSNFASGVNNFSNQILGAFGYRTPPKEELYSYSGGPGSDNGIGITTIYKYDPIVFDTNNINFKNLKNSFIIRDDPERKKEERNIENNKFWDNNLSIEIGNRRFIEGIGNRPSMFLDNGLLSYSQEFISQFTTFYGNNVLPSSDPLRFTTSGSVKTTEYNNGKLSPYISDYYSTKPINDTKRIGSSSYSSTGGIINPNFYYNSSSLSENNVTNIEQNSKNDIIPFRIEIIDLELPEQSYYLYFKAFIDNFSDDFRANYESIVSPGNPTGKMFKYQSFDRTLSLNFKIAIFREEEAENIYKKLNRLASTTLPTNTNGGIRSTITKLTVGNWCKRLPGVINSINFTNLVSNPWDIDNKRPMVIDVSMGYQYSSIYDDDNSILYSSPDIEYKLLGNPNAA
jgi:hypothetical protein